MQTQRRVSNQAHSFKFFTYFTLFFFCWTQVTPFSYALPAEQKTLTQTDLTPVKTVEDAETAPVSVTEEEAQDLTQDFLQSELVLEKVSSRAEEEETSEEDSEVQDEASAFDAILNTLNEAKNFAAAVIEKINAENLLKLAKQAYEFGLAVIDGVLVLFTSHEESQLSVTEGFKKLFDSAAQFMAHFQVSHGAAPAQKDPSLMDRQNAKGTEYVVSQQDENLAVVEYDSASINSEVKDAGYLLTKLAEVYDPVQAAQKRIKNFIEAEMMNEMEALLAFRSDPPTSFPNESVLSSFASTSPSATASITQPSSTQFTLTYDVRNNSSFAGAVMAFGSTDLSSFSKFTFEMKTDNDCGGGANCVKVEFQDTSSRTATVVLQGLTNSFQQIDISQQQLCQSNPSMFTGGGVCTASSRFLSPIRQINFVVDSGMHNPSTSFAVQQNLTINTTNLSFTPTVTGTTYDQSQLTDLPANPVATGHSGSAGGTANGTITLNQTSARDLSFNYTLADSDDFVYSVINFPSAQNLGTTQPKLALTIPSGRTLKAEVKEASGKVADFLLTGTGAKLNYTLDLSAANIPAGFNTAQIKEIVLVADLSKMGASGTVVLETKGLDYLPTVTGGVYNQAALTSLTGNPVLASTSASAGGAANGTIALNQTSPRDFSFNYTLADSDDFVFVVAGFPAAQNLGSSITMALTIPSGKQLKVEVKDSGNRVADFLLTGTGAKQNYTLNLSADNIPGGFNVTQIKEIVFVSDLSRMGASGTVAVETVGLNYQGDVNGTAYNQAALTTLPGNPSLSGTSASAGGTSNGTISVSQSSPRDAQFTYTLADADDFVFLNTSFPTPQNLGSSVVLALTIPSGKKLKVEVKDSGNRIADFFLIGTGAKQNYTLALSGDNIPSGFDTAQITNIIFTADLSNMGASGTVVLETKGLDYQPSVTGTAYSQPALTTLPGSPVVSSVSSAANGGTANGTIALSQTSPRDVSFNYTLADADDFVFTTFSFPSSQDLSAGITIALNIPAGKQLKVEVIDNTGKVADFYLNGTGAKQNYSLALNGDNIPSGFDATKIAFLVFTADLSHMGASGTVAIETNGLDYQPSITGTAYNQGTLSTLPGNPAVSSASSATPGNTANGTISVSQSSPRDVLFNYSLADDNDFVFLNFAFPSVQNLGSSVVLALTIPAGKQLKVEVRDSGNRVADFFLTGTGAKQNYTLPLSGDNIPSGFDTAQIQSITFASDLAHMGASGTVAIETKGLDYQPSVTGTAYSQAALTDLPGAPTVSGTSSATPGNTANGSITVNQTSPRDVSFDYTLADSNDFVFLNFGFPSNQNLGNSITFALTIPAGKQLKAEVKDSGNRIADFFLTGTGAKQNYTLNLTGDNIPSGFDTTQIQSITFASDLSHMGASGTVAIETKGLDYQAGISGTAYNQAALTSLTGNPQVASSSLATTGNTADGTITVNQTGTKDVSFNYTLADSNDFVTLSFGFPTSQNLGTGITLALTIPAGKQLKVEVKDETDKTADYFLIGTGAKQNYTLPLTGDNLPAGFDVTKIKNIIFSGDLSHMGASGTVAIETVGLSYSPAITGTAFDANAITGLPNSPVLAAGGGKTDAADPFDGVGTVSQVSSTEFNFGYNLNGGPSNFAYATIDIPGTTGGTLPNSFVLGLNGPNGAKAKVEIKDVNGNIADFILNLTGSLQNYTMTLSGDGIPAGFDRTKVSDITIVMDRSLVGLTGNTGTINVRTKDLSFSPSVNGTAFDANAITSIPGSPVLASGGGKTNPADAFEGVGTVTQVSSTEFNFGYNLNGGASNFAYATIDIPASGGGTLPANFVLGLNGPNGAKAKVEIKDINGNIADFILNLTGSLQNYTLALSGDGIPAGFDRTKVSDITIVMDRALANFTGNTGTLNVRVKDLSFSPSVSGTAFDANAITSIPGSPVLASGGGKTNPADPFDGVGTVSQVSSTEFNFGYNLNGGASNFAYATIDIPASGGETLPANFVLGLNGPNGAKAKVEIKDINGNVADFILNLTGSLQNYTLSLSGDGIPAGFDRTKVSEITIVMDRALANFTGNVGTLNVRVKDLSFSPTVSGTAFDANAITSLPSFPTLGSGGGKTNPADPFDGVGTVTQVSSTEFNFGYNLNGGASDFAYATIDIPGTNGGTLPNNFVLGLNGPNGAKAKVEVRDINGNIADFILNLTGSLQNYTLTLSGDGVPAGFDRTKVNDITIVMDRALANFTGNVGTINVRTKDLSFSPTITGTAFDSNTITSIPGFPVLASGGGKTNPADPFDGVGTVSQVSSTEFNFGYNLNGGASDFAYATIDIPGTNGATLPANYIIGLNGPNGAKAKIEIKDINGNIADFTLNLTGALQNYTLPLTGDGIPSGFDRTKVSEITIVMDRALANFTGNVGTINVRVQDLNFAPTVAPAAFDANLHTSLPNSPVLASSGGKTNPADPFEGVGTVSQVSTSEFNFGYNLNGGPSNFAVATIDIPGTNGGTLPNNFVLGLNGPNGAKVKVEVKDINGNVADYVLTLTGALQNYTLTLSGDGIEAAFDRTKVSEINFVMDRALANFTGNVGTINIRTKDLSFTPFVSGTAFDANAITSLPNFPVLASGGGKTNPADAFDGVGTVSQVSSTEFNFGYNLNGGASNYAYATIDILGTNGGTLPDSFVLGLNGPNGAKAKVEVKDINGNIADFTLNLTGALQNYTLTLSGEGVPAGFDRTKVSEITIVMDRTLANFTGNVGTINVRTKDLSFSPTVTGTAFDANAVSTAPNSPAVSGGGGKTNPADPFDGVGTVSQVSSSEFNFAYNLNGGASNYAFATVDIPGANGGTLPESFVIGVNGPNGAKAKVEIKDANGIVADFVLNLTGSLQNYTLTLSGDGIPAGFDRTKVSEITIVMDRALANFTGNTGTLNVRLKGLSFTPTVNGTTFDEFQITTLTNSPSISATGTNTTSGQPSATISASILSSNELEYVYDVSPSTTSFTFVNVFNGGFDSGGVFQGTAGSLPENFVLAARGSEGAQVLVQIVDTSHRVADFTLNLKSTYQNYTLVLSGDNVPAGFDRTNIAQILFVQDQNLAGNFLNDLVQIKMNGLNYIPPVFPAALQTVKDKLVDLGMDYFRAGFGVDPVTHFPYDSTEANGLPDTSATFTQPTLIGFYLQLLGDVVRGKITSSDLTVDEAVNEIDAVMNSLLTYQADTSISWNGLLPFIDLAPPGVTPMVNTIGLIDNANLAQSLATMAGALDLQLASLTPAQQTLVNTIKTKVETFLDEQEAGYNLFVDPTFGVFRSGVNRVTGVFDGYVDRVSNESIGAIVFLRTRFYTTIPDSVWNNLTTVFADYTDRNGNVIKNLSSFEGGAFQIFWPLLRNDERDFIGLRNVLHNQYVTQADYAFQYRIPGFLSASQRPMNSSNPAGAYFGRIGIPQLAETSLDILGDVGSTYALASAYAVNPFSVLTWLNSIEDQLDNLDGLYGFQDAARSNTEIAQRFLGIDVASTILGLTNSGPEEFERYLRNRGAETQYNLIYDSLSLKLASVKATTSAIAAPPELPDRSFAVFSHVASSGDINGFPINATNFTGVQFTYGALAGGFGGQYWVLDQDYDAQANQLVMQYTASDSPQEIKLEFKDGGDNLLYATTVALPAASMETRVVVNLPNQTRLNTVRKVFVIVDQNATGDTSGNFKINFMDFQHVPSSQDLTPNAALDSGDVTVLSGNPPAQLVASNPPGNSLVRNGIETTLNYDVSGGNFSGISVNYEPSSTDLTAFTEFVIGIESSSAHEVKVEIDDVHGNRAILYLTQVDSTRRYYSFLTSLLASSVDLSQVKKINFIVDQNSVSSTTGTLELELGGLQ